MQRRDELVLDGCAPGHIVRDHLAGECGTCCSEGRADKNYNAEAEDEGCGYRLVDGGL
jgi:hypothetical protein